MVFPKQKKTYNYCSLEENGVIVESDMVETNDLKDYFKDSFNHHLGKKPTKKQILDYLDGKNVIVLDGNLTLIWNKA